MNNTPSPLSRIVAWINARRLDIGIIILLFIFTIQLLEYFGIYPAWFNEPSPIEFEEMEIFYEDLDPQNPNDFEVTYGDEYYTDQAEFSHATSTVHLGGYNARGYRTSFYVKNDSGIFYDGKSLAADPATFDVLKGDLAPMMGDLTYTYAKDTDRVFYNGIEVVGAQPNTFIPLENGAGEHSFGTDGVSVFYGSKKIEGADPSTFTILWKTLYEGCRKGSYSKDKNSVYIHEESYLEEGNVFSTHIVPGADPNTFESLVDMYGKDIRGYYKNGMYIGPTIDERLLECNYG